MPGVPGGNIPGIMGGAGVDILEGPGVAKPECPGEDITEALWPISDWGRPVIIPGKNSGNYVILSYLCELNNIIRKLCQCQLPSTNNLHWFWIYQFFNNKLIEIMTLECLI